MTTNNVLKVRHWEPIKEVSDSVEDFCKVNSLSNILEIGPGLINFPLATKFVGCNEKFNKDYIDIDIDVERIPFDDKSIDFVYSRHTLEDIQNPDFVMKEIIRISKSGGYIETPSILTEITKGVDGGNCSSKYCGYIHHRYIVWSDIEKCEIHFLPKYSAILDNLVTLDYNIVYQYLNASPLFWNNYFIWGKDKSPKIIMYKNGVNMGINNGLLEDYFNIINKGVNTYLKNTEYFVNNYLNKPTPN